MVRSQGKRRNVENATELSNIVGIAIQQHYSNASTGGGARNLRMRGRSRWFEDDCVGSRGRRGLDNGQQLLALPDVVITSLDNLEVHSPFARRMLLRLRLL